jgi:hypothetical protein
MMGPVEFRINLVGDYFKTMFVAKVTKFFHETGKVQYITKLEDKFGWDGMMHIPRRGALDPD